MPDAGAFMFAENLPAHLCGSSPAGPAPPPGARQTQTGRTWSGWLTNAYRAKESPGPASVSEDRFSRTFWY